MSRRFQLSPAGLSRYRQWRDSPSTTSHDIALTLEVLVAIAQGGWPPTTSGNPPSPRWLYFRHTEHLEQWVVAPTEDLWVIVHLDEEDRTFDFVNAYRPDEDDKKLAPWLTDPDAAGPEAPD